MTQLCRGFFSLEFHLKACLIALMPTKSMPLTVNVRARISILFAALTGMFLASTPSMAWAIAPTLCTDTDEGVCTGHLNLSGVYKLPYYRNYALSKNTDVTRAVIVIHGLKRNARSAFEAALEAAGKAGQKSSALIVAPLFQEATEDADELFWQKGKGDWAIGDRDDSAAKRSSFAVVDEIIAKLNDRTTFPNLKTLVILGHSAGGQFVSRFAAGSKAEATFNGKIRYIPANAGTYMYFSGHRPRLSSPYTFAIPSASQNCSSTYNNYRYGSANRNEYMTMPFSELTSNFTKRDIRMLLGSLDTDTDADDLPSSCPANLQGLQRFERGTWYSEYVKWYFGSTAALRKYVVPGVAHNSYGMYNSAVGLQHIFDYTKPSTDCADECRGSRDDCLASVIAGEGGTSAQCIQIFNACMNGC